MTTYSLTLRDVHVEALKTHLLRGDGNEHAAYLLCRKAAIRRDPWDRQAHRKYLCTEVIPVPDDQIIESTPHLVSWSTVSFVRALRRAAETGQTVAIVHNHLPG